MPSIIQLLTRKKKTKPFDFHEKITNSFCIDDEEKITIWFG